MKDKTDPRISLTEEFDYDLDECTPTMGPFRIAVKQERRINRLEKCYKGIHESQLREETEAKNNGRWLKGIGSIALVMLALILSGVAWMTFTIVRNETKIQSLQATDVELSKRIDRVEGRRHWGD